MYAYIVHSNIHTYICMCIYVNSEELKCIITIKKRCKENELSALLHFIKFLSDHHEAP